MCVSIASVLVLSCGGSFVEALHTDRSESSTVSVFIHFHSYSIPRTCNVLVKLRNEKKVEKKMKT